MENFIRLNAENDAQAININHISAVNWLDKGFWHVKVGFVSGITVDYWNADAREILIRFNLANSTTEAKNY